MRKLNNQECQSAEISGGALGEFLSTLAGAGLGAGVATKYLHGTNVYWLGLVKVPLTLAGGYLGGKIGHMIHNLDSSTTPDDRKSSIVANFVG